MLLMSAQSPRWSRWNQAHPTSQIFLILQMEWMVAIAIIASLLLHQFLPVSKLLPSLLSLSIEPNRKQNFHNDGKV